MLRLAAAAALLAAPLALAADTQPAKPFNGKDLAGWKAKDEKKSHWKAMDKSEPVLDANDPTRFLGGVKEGPSTLVNVTGGGCDIFTTEKYGDGKYEVEFMVPKGSNSGVYLMGEYEVQVLDSYGKPADKLTQGDLGALYSAAAPKVNAAKAPGEWQKFEIVFRAPKFDGDKKVANAKFEKVTLNGTVLHENVEMKGVTPGGLTGKEAATGPLMFQGDHGPVAYRNIKITPLAK
ncbi:MAG: DUF1080 domain-containing protein [Gemmataceae bacterium]|nr:DUF1080 domain-containing protein [Gemmataceae bacterium]